MVHIQYKTFGQLTLSDYEVFSSVPPHPFWSRVEQVVDFSFADKLCAPLYSHNGQRPYAPSLKLKIHFAQRYHNYSDREMEEAILYHLHLKRFLGVPVAFNGFDHSTLGLDRNRMGSDLFDACHHHILSQAMAKGLWGKENDRWLIDSFHTYANIAKVGAYRLIQQGILQIIQHIKRTYPKLYTFLLQDCDLKGFLKRLSDRTPEKDRLVLFSRLVVEAYSLLHWLESERVQPLFWTWEKAKPQLRCLELQAILYQILQENTKPVGPNKPEGAKQEPIQYQELSKKEKPQDRIRSAYDPEIRSGYKSKSLKFTGDKIQVLESREHGLILNTEPIPGNEWDGDRLVPMVKEVIDRHGIVPKQLIGDTAYGTGENRQKITEMQILLAAPIQKNSNSTGLLEHDWFVYDAKLDEVTCPQGYSTSKKVRNNPNQGYQFKFEPQTCQACPQFEQCTTNKKGRTVFISDFYEIMEQGKSYNQTEAGKSALKARYDVERTNNELANHHGLRTPRTSGRESLRITSKLTAMVINMKIMVKKLAEPIKPFYRYKKYENRVKAPVCPN
ncbi:transposase [Schinkia azotoformans]|nr:transposase [Schinkia azotoformans]MEC1718729.1 transposase [Schinkia azotoformans]MEC1725192.1 transposase [Schinkia azotoformans]MEC1743628.1 transposase [Schinkia azotoformans]MEC1748155.1 transposase [Schinkia azotoformans]MEC1756810.1 transposase [Schinkia azotoformans]